ncbi:hypothetical protein FoTM2_010804 [Fusarium oxysporum f. sp. vasinfectum]|nr:hypothetical protein FoTM2_010804 [Fusarium oxysporum f. sp. vasinfectum]
MNDVIVALDDIIVDLKPLAPQDSAEEMPRTFHVGKFSLDSLSVNESAFSYSKPSDDTWKEYPCSLSFVPEPEDRQVTAATGNDDHIFVFKHDRLQQKVNSWLSKLPDLPGADLRPCNTILQDLSRPPERHETWDNKESPLLESLECKDSCITWISSTTAIVVIMLQER